MARLTAARRAAVRANYHHLFQRNKRSGSTLKFRQNGGPMIFRPQAPPAYTGTRLSICGVLALGVTCFFVVYDGIAHRGTPSEPRVLQASHREQDYPLRPTRFEDVPAPDMTSPDVTFANADVSVPAQSQSPQKLPDPGDPTVKATAAPEKRAVRKVQVTRGVKPARHGRPTRIATIRNRQDGRAAYAQGFFSFAPFGGF